MLVAENGEVFSIHDCSGSRMLVEMFKDDGVGSTAASDASSEEHRIDMPFAASVVQRVSMLINEDKAWSSGCAFLPETELPSLVAACDFLMLEGPAVARLHSECGLLPRDVSNGGMAIDLHEYNTVLASHLGLTATLVSDEKVNQPLLYRADGSSRLPLWFDPTAVCGIPTSTTYTENEVACALRSARLPPQLVSMTTAGQRVCSWGKLFKRQLPSLIHRVTAPEVPLTRTAEVKAQQPGGAQQPAGAPPSFKGRLFRSNIEGITKESIDMALRRAGVIIASELIYEESRGILHVYMQNVLRNAIIFSEHARERIITASHITQALVNDNGACGLYGFGHPRLPSHMWSDWV